MTPDDAIQDAIRLIAAVPGYHNVAIDLRRRRPLFAPGMTDRGQASLRGTIHIGPETLAGTEDAVRVSLAGTLVHEHWHTQQNPLLKTVSFWGGVFTRTHPMSRYERPAYAHQMSFLKALAASHPILAQQAEREYSAVWASFEVFYGVTPDVTSHRR